MVTVMPLKLTPLLPCITPGTAAGAGPEPESTVSETSVAPAADTRLVTPIFRNTARLSVITVPGLPPEQVITISPSNSAIPSARRAGLTAESVQVKVEDWGWAIPMEIRKSDNVSKTRVNIRLLKEKADTFMTDVPKVA